MILSFAYLLLWLLTELPGFNIMDRTEHNLTKLQATKYQSKMAKLYRLIMKYLQYLCEYIKMPPGPSS